MFNDQQARELDGRLGRIVQLAREIEAVPNFGPDIWTMRKVDEKCRVIRGDCDALGHLIGTGDVLHQTLGPGLHPVTTQAAGLAQQHVRRIAALALAIEEVPNFGPDIWTMRKIDEECRQIVWHAQAIPPVLFPAGTGHAAR